MILVLVVVAEANFFHHWHHLLLILVQTYILLRNNGGHFEKCAPLKNTQGQENVISLVENMHDLIPNMFL